MADKKISEMTTASVVDSDDNLELSHSVNGGFTSLKASILAIATKILTGINFASALETTDKTVLGAINEVAQGGGGTTVIANPTGTPTDELETIQIGNDIYEIVGGGGGSADWTDVVGTLEAGDTEIVLTSNKITTNSAVFPWTDKFGVSPSNMVVANGSVTLTFPVQSTDLGVMVRVTKVGNTPEPTPIDTTNTSKYNESSMSVVSSSSQMASAWNGGNSIGLTFYLTNPIDVTDLTKLSYELQTGSCYGSGSQAQQEAWNVQIGLMATAPSAILSGTYSELNFAAGDDFANSNTNYGTQEIDVSSLSGTYYLVVNAHGWNATISNLREE